MVYGSAGRDSCMHIAVQDGHAKSDTAAFRAEERGISQGLLKHKIARRER